MLTQQQTNAIKLFQRYCRERMSRIRTLPAFTHNRQQLQYNSIFTFLPTSDRDQNDANNKIRESLISAVINKQIPQEYYYSIIWKSFIDKLFHYLEQVFRCPHSGTYSYSCKIMAGRNYNYDFSVTATNRSTRIEETKKIEFKFNAKQISNCPQFFSVSSKANPTVSYAEHFYNTCVPIITQMYELQNIDKTAYIKCVHQTNYNKHPWFETLYQTENSDPEKMKRKKELVDNSIHTFLLDRYLQTDVEQEIKMWNKRFQESQGGKIYMLYCAKEKRFYIDEITEDELNIDLNNMTLGVGKSNNVHTLVFHTGEDRSTKIGFLLRWRNHAGILNPAWQISLTR
jgi:hypothetical protein